jgi:6-phosphogluconate dehydrogenase
MSQADIGLIGLAVMGENLVLNMAHHGYTVAVFNRTVAKVDKFLAEKAQGTTVLGTHSLQEFVASLKKPRRIMMMVKAGPAVDDFINQLLPLLEKGDILIDGGNSFFQDTNRRTHELANKGILYIGTGISGGEEGALKGPSIMPGGHPEAWPHVQPIFQAIAAQVDGTPCCDWVGPDGAGHFVKMVHNGIEYGDMQLIAEVYDILRKVLNMEPPELHDVFAEWNRGDLDSYLIDITSQIFTKKDPETGKYLVDVILDAAGQKGTGKWTTLESLELGVPVTMITEAVFARSMSALKDERVSASDVLKGPRAKFAGNRKAVIDTLRQALYVAKICYYAQGFALLKQAAHEYNWPLNFGSIAMLWRGGCIIRARFLNRIKEAFDRNPSLHNLLLDPYFMKIVTGRQTNLRRVVALAARFGIPVPVFSAALAYYDSYRSHQLPANLIQAQRDFFGAHTYERIDKPRGDFLHTEWGESERSKQ